MNLQDFVDNHRKRMKYSNRDLLGKLQEEVDELHVAVSKRDREMELADVIITAIAYASLNKIDVYKAVETKASLRELGKL